MPPYIGLVISSIGFILPAFVAWRRRRRFDALASGTLTLTSIAYHGTLNPFFHKIDLVVAHTLGILSIPRSFIRLIRWKRRWVEGVIFVGTVGAIGIYWFKSKQNLYDDSKLWHIGFHLMCQTTWLAHLMVPDTLRKLNTS